MTRNNLLFLLLLSSFTAFAQQVKPGKDQCTQCNMVVKDQHFVAVAVQKNGKQLTFDAIECLVNYLKTAEQMDFSHLLVTDYSRPGKWLNAADAVYLKSNFIPSPMGAYLSAYADIETARKVRTIQGGDIFDWQALRQKFEGSNFGVINHPDHHHRPDAYAPIGIMGGHAHHKGGFMVSLRYMHMTMAGNRTNAGLTSNQDIYNAYMAASQRMDMDMYMLGVMYAPSDRLTLMIMQPFLQNIMSMKAMQMGNSMSISSPSFVSYQTKTAGLGDLKLLALYSLVTGEKTSFHLNTGVSLPRGNIANMGNTPLADGMRLPYAMQLGSGTIDMILGGTFRQAFNKMSLGVQQLNTLRTGKNGEGYRLGNQYQLNTWVARSLGPQLSLSARVEGLVVSGLHGSDGELNQMMSPQANSVNSGLTRVSTYLGANVGFRSNSIMRNLKLGAEVGMPFYQRVNGIQMNQKVALNFGLRYLI